MRPTSRSLPSWGRLEHLADRTLCPDPTLDGCRVLNRVNGKHYPRYFFDQVSSDIRRLFCEACDRLGIEYTWSRWKTVSIARSGSVALLDEFVGPKT